MNEETDIARVHIGNSIANRVMLAHDFNPAKYETADHLVSFKLDGLRAVYVPNYGFYSRDGIPWSKHLTKHIRIQDDRLEGLQLDGEFYCHGMSLQDINSAMAINRGQPTDNTNRVSFHVFDLLNFARPALERVEKLKYLQLCGYFQSNVVNINHSATKCWAQVKNNFDAAIASDHEGVMLRTSHGYYQPGRSRSLLKWKKDTILDAVAVDMQIGEGKFAGMLGSMKFRTRDGVEFWTGSGWVDEERTHIWRNKEDYMCREATIKCLTLSNDGTPKMSTFMKWNNK